MRYTPANLPAGVREPLAGWLANELRRIAAQTMAHTPDLVPLEERGSEPARPSNGMIVYANGVEWDPGSGEGFYGYEAGAWVKL